MPAGTLKHPTLLASMALLPLAAALGCGGAARPALSSLTIGPKTLVLPAAHNRQLTAIGKYSDGTSITLTSAVQWTSSDAACAAIDAGGLLAAAQTVSGLCTANVTATSGGITSAAATITVTQGTLQSITLIASTLSPFEAGTMTFTALGNYGGVAQPLDITTMVTWNNDNPAVLTLTQGSGIASIGKESVLKMARVSASFDDITSNTLTITVA